MKKVESTLQLEKIKDPLFLVGLGILLLNDFYLKYAFSNAFTGKLSDVAGLFIFPFFFLCPMASEIKTHLLVYNCCFYLLEVTVFASFN